MINDLIGEDSEVAISFGLYRWDSTNDNYKELTDFGEFQKVLRIDLQKERPEEYEDETYFDIYVKTESWKNGSRNEILKAIADDEMSNVCKSVKEMCHCTL